MLPWRVECTVFRFNYLPLDYGPTIILEHSIGGSPLFTLYGHLSLDSIQGLKEGQEVAVGQQIASVGDRLVNGDWTPHVHFQLIRDMRGNKGDYPGMASLSDRETYLDLCPDPDLVLNLGGNGPDADG